MKKLYLFLCLILGAATLVFVAPGCSSSDETAVNADEFLDHYERDRRRHDPNTFVEVDLGEFFVTQRQSATESYFVRFHIYGVMPEDQTNEFTKALSSRGERMRDAVISTVRRSDLEHLAEPELAFLKSELIPTINHALKTRVVRDVVFTSYSLERS